jgi:RND family efflux transporter MFP subunit
VVVAVQRLEGEAVRAGAPLAVVQSAEVLQWSAMAQRAGAEATLAASRARRDQALLAEGVVARARVEESQARAQQASADLVEAQRALALAPRGGAAPGQYELRAPTAGRVLRRDVQPGDAVTAGEVAFLVGNDAVLDVALRVPVAVAARLRPGMPARLSASTTEGKVVAVAAATAVGSPTVPVRVRFGRDAGVLIGQQVAIDVAMPAPAASWRVPVAAVVRQGDAAYVFVQATGGFRAVRVSVLGDAADGLVVAGGLRAGERVAISATTALMSLLAAE